MTVSAQHAAVRRFYEEVWERHELSRLADILHEGFTFRGSLGPELRGQAVFARYVDEVHSALADNHCDVDDLVEEMVARMRIRMP